MIYKSIERSQAYVAALALAQVFQKSDDHFKLFKKVSRLAYGSDDSERVPFNDAQLTIWKKESIILRLSALGWTLDSIAKQTGYSDKSGVSKIVKNTNFGNFHNFLKQGNTLQKALEVFGYDYPMAYSILFKDKSDQERFKELEWGLRTWDYWNFNDCDQRFGEDWPGSWLTW